MMPKLVVLIAGLLSIGAVEVAIHWYASARTDRPAVVLRDLYLYTDRDNGKPYVAGMIDIVMPAILYGLLVGIVTARWSPRALLSG